MLPIYETFMNWCFLCLLGLSILKFPRISFHNSACCVLCLGQQLRRGQCFHHIMGKMSKTIAGHQQCQVGRQGTSGPESVQSRKACPLLNPMLSKGLCWKWLTMSVTPSLTRWGIMASSLRNLLPPRIGCSRSSWIRSNSPCGECNEIRLIYRRRNRAETS